MNLEFLQGKSILVTGGTGSFGNYFVRTLLRYAKPRRMVVFSRDELKQYEMAQEFPERRYPCLRYFIGDVRDRDRVMRACSGVEIIIHAAAMKHITAAEYNPTECIATNILGAENVINAAISHDVQQVIALSTDKAANPINLYGATKLCSDKLFIAANNLAGKHRTRFAVVRYGNVVGSRGSVIPFFKRLVTEGRNALPITDLEMTRFVITLEQGVSTVLMALQAMTGGETFVPKLPSVKMVDIARVISPDGRLEVVGVRPGEKLHEIMIPYEESRNCIDMGEYYILQPTHHWWNTKDLDAKVRANGKPVTEAFEYSSRTNDWWLTPEEMRVLVDSVPAA